jgi:co-chaperonin GroES (HSP10)
MNIVIPCNKQVLIAPLKSAKDKEREAAGLIMDTAASPSSRRGVVLAIGPQVTSGAFKQGDTVLYRGHSFETIKEEDETFVLTEEENIVAKIVEASANF